MHLWCPHESSCTMLTLSLCRSGSDLVCRFCSQDRGSARRHQHRARQDPDRGLRLFWRRQTHPVVAWRQNHSDHRRRAFPHRDLRGPDDAHHHGGEGRRCWNLHPGALQRAGIGLSKRSHQHSISVNQTMLENLPNEPFPHFPFYLLPEQKILPGKDLDFCSCKYELFLYQS